MTNIDWDPSTYLETMLAAIPKYRELEDRTAAATADLDVRNVLELGVGTGETAERVLARHPGARLTGIDASPQMLVEARKRLPHADLRLARLEDQLPNGPFDLVVSVLVVHHLAASEKRDLFRRVAGVLRPGGRFVLADVVVPERPEDARVEIDGVVDVPDRLDDQLSWLREAGFAAEAVWEDGDLAVVRADR